MRSRIHLPAALPLACLVLLGAAGPARTAADPGPDRPGVRPWEPLQERIIEVSDRVKPSVVHIEAIVKVNDRRNQVTGSGVIASAEGEILTNHHVVEHAEQVTVTIPGRKGKVEAEVVGSDKQTDIALLRIEPEGELAVAEFGSAEDLRVGQWVLAIGNPYGLDGTVSFGIVSAKGRNLEIPHLLNDFIQTDAMIDRGSSGGPLVDLDGRVVGINSRGQGRGIGFTIPIDTALEVMQQIAEGGIERGWLGITVQPVDRDLAAYFGDPDLAGVLVNSVSRHSPAERAGLEPGDIIVAFDGHPVEAEKEEDLGRFQRMVASHDPGDEVRLRFRRDGREREVEVELGRQPKVVPEEAETEDGFHVQEITESLYREQRLPTRKGVYVSFVARGSPASEAGLHRGDVVVRIEDRKVEDIEDFEKAMEAVEDRDRLLVTTRRGQETKFLLLKRRPVIRAAEDDQRDELGARSRPPKNVRAAPEGAPDRRP